MVSLAQKTKQNTTPQVSMLLTLTLPKTEERQASTVTSSHVLYPSPGASRLGTQ